ncbi:GNAT family N-acetyltransferase [Thalassotalea psychrophila]|uniref:GNAT family N-acetyltransferase n=1 Tax=Thalassotalea psychrophila TaxID=3065647 RepID=A0ABY9TQQ9_9GAMM|nr:GNAT family N-acetyltransferase [Colwelliaceae bacterium SQ149]
MQIQLATKADKSVIKRFYKNNRYSASFMGEDQCFYISNNDAEIIACVIVSYTTTTPFLHALVVKQDQQKIGLARQLVIKCQQQYNDITCFADSDLTEFYQKLGFALINVAELPVNLQPRFQAYNQNNLNLQCFQYRSGIRN